jgi:hypothetical protein
VSPPFPTIGKGHPQAAQNSRARELLAPGRFGPLSHIYVRLAGHIGLELPNPCANYLFEVP